jgi:hypothetical protein
MIDQRRSSESVSEARIGNMMGMAANELEVGSLCCCPEIRCSSQVCALVGEVGGLREAIAASAAKLKEDLVSIQREAKDSLQQSQEREAQAIADMRNAVWGLGARLQTVVEERGHQVLAAAEMRQTNEQLQTEVAELKQRVEVRDLGEVSDCCPKVKKDLTSLEQQLAKLKEEMREMRPKAVPLASPATDGAVPSAPEAASPARKSSSSSPSQTMAPPPERAKQFPPLAKRGKHFDVPDGIIAHLTRERGGNVHDHHIVEVTSESFERGTHKGKVGLLRRMQLIRELMQYSIHHGGRGKRISRTPGTIDCATISSRSGLCQGITQSAQMDVLPAKLI